MRALELIRSGLAQRGGRALLLRAALGTGGWLVITEGELGALAFGGPVVLLAVVASLWLPAPASPRWSAPGLARFAVALLLGSLKGGAQVAWLALAPRLALSPRWLQYPLRLASAPGRHLFMGALTLMPGTLAVRLEGDTLEVHVLVDTGAQQHEQLRVLEERVGRAVGEWGPAHA